MERDREMIGYGRNGTGNWFPAWIFRPKCARIAINRIPRALFMTNAIEMRLSAFPGVLFLENATGMREFSIRVAFPTGNVSEDVGDGSFRLISAPNFPEMNQIVTFRLFFDSFPPPIPEEAP